MKNVTKKLLIAIDTEESPEKVQELLSSSYTVLDKAAKKGVIHKNKASRKKSRLTIRAKNYLESHK
jgi:small subunit ribosomal protein S20